MWLETQQWMVMRSLWNPTQCCETILLTEEKWVKWTNTYILMCDSDKRGKRWMKTHGTCSRRMLFRAVSSSCDRSTESIWLPNSWMLWFKIEKYQICHKVLTARVFIFPLQLKQSPVWSTTFSRTQFTTHLSVTDGDVDDDVLVSRRDGRTIDWNAVDPLFVARNSHGRGLRKSEQNRHSWVRTVRSGDLFWLKLRIVRFGGVQCHRGTGETQTKNISYNIYKKISFSNV